MKKAFISLIALLLSLAASAQPKRTIHVATAGTLSNYISENEKYQIEELTLTGELNGTDFRLIRDMAGINYGWVQHGEVTEDIYTDGKLITINLSGVKIVEGGIYYGFEHLIGGMWYSTENNKLTSHLFYGTKLKSIILPISVSKILASAFYGSNELISIIVDADNEFYDSRDNCNAVIETQTNTLIAGCKNTIIPNNVTSIGEEAFSDCSGLTSLAIPSSVRRIEDSAFSYCSGLESISVDSGNTKYDSRNHCNAIIETQTNTLIAGCKNTIIPNNVTSIGRHAFSGCRGLTSLTLPNSVDSIGGYAFSGCSGLTSLNIPSSVTSIGTCAFFNCSGLTSITIPNGVTSIGDRAFSFCSGLTTIVSEIENPFAITDDVFNCNDKDIYATATLNVPSGKKTVYQNTTGWKKFQNIVEAELMGYEFENNGIRYKIGENNTVSVISRDSRYSGDLVIPEQVTYNGATYSVTTIGFIGVCPGLLSVTIPPSIKSIAFDAFEECINLNAVNITDIASWCNISFANHYSNPLSEAHHLFLNGKEVTDLVIPNSVTSIGSYAFRNCSGLTSITIPNSVTSIGEGAFSGCSGLTSITIPNSVTSIGNSAFRYCSGLTSIKVESGNNNYDSRNNCNAIIEKSSNTLITGCQNTIIPNSVTSIGEDAFMYCSGLTSITIPNSVTSIDNYAFSGCNGLTSIVSEIEAPFAISDYVFSCYNKDIYATATLIVPPGKKSSYQNTAGWNKFQNIVEAESDQSVFEENGITYFGTVSTQMAVVQSVSSGVKNVAIPESVYYDGKTYQVTAVADNAFLGLDVNYISLPASVTSVTDKTFSRCNMGALIWNAETTLPGNTFSNASMGTDANFLLYVKSASYAPSTVKNVVVDGTASSVLLSDDGGKFYCPEQFKANSISYTHYYYMETGGGKGWETLTLPFDVQKISHSTRGEIIPFAAYRSGLSQKPFWLANFSVSGFKRTSAILANEPYIIAMPNSSNYNNDYNLAGGVTFSSENIVVPKTPMFNGTFLPAYTTVPKSPTVYAMNVSNRYVKYSGSYDAGSRFINNLRDIRPFEAYISDSSTRGICEISFDDGTTDLDDILLSADDSQEITIHTLSGQQMARTTQRDFDQIWNRLPKGVYIVNGKKMIK